MRTRRRWLESNGPPGKSARSQRKPRQLPSAGDNRRHRTTPRRTSRDLGAALTQKRSLQTPPSAIVGPSTSLAASGRSLANIDDCGRAWKACCDAPTNAGMAESARPRRYQDLSPVLRASAISGYVHLVDDAAESEVLGVPVRQAMWRRIMLLCPWSVWWSVPSCAESRARPCRLGGLQCLRPPPRSDRR